MSLFYYHNPTDEIYINANLCESAELIGYTLYIARRELPLLLEDAYIEPIKLIIPFSELAGFDALFASVTDTLIFLDPDYGSHVCRTLNVLTEKAKLLREITKNRRAVLGEQVRLWITNLIR